MDILIPFVISTVLVLAVVVLCIVKPNAGRIFLGFFFLVMGFGVNGSFTFTDPDAYIKYAQGAWFPLYGELALWVVKINPMLFGLVLIVFEVVMGLLILGKHQAVKIGLLGTMLFLVGIAPLSLLQLPWLGLLVGQVFLWRQEFEHSFVDSVRAIFQPHSTGV